MRTASPNVGIPRLEFGQLTAYSQGYELCWSQSVVFWSVTSRSFWRELTVFGRSRQHRGYDPLRLCTQATVQFVVTVR